MRQLCAVECSIIAKEIGVFVGKRVVKVFGKDENYFIKFGKQGVAIRMPYTISLAEPPKEKECEGFAQRLRSILKGKRLDTVEQVSYDRIIRMDFGEYSLYIELFGKGNIILCRQSSIEFAKIQREYKHRKIKRGEPYIEPPKRKEVEKSNKVIVELINLGLTRDYALGIMKDEGIDEKDSVEAVGPKWEMLVERVEKLRNANNFYATDTDYGIGNKGEKYETLSKAIEHVYSLAKANEQIDPEEEKRNRIIKQLKARISELEKKIKWMDENKEEIEQILSLFKEKRFEEIKSIGWIIDFQRRKLRKMLKD